MYLASLERYVGPDQPLYQFSVEQNHNGKRAPYTTIESLAAYYVREIRLVQAQGPYFMGDTLAIVCKGLVDIDCAVMSGTYSGFGHRQLENECAVFTASPASRDWQEAEGPWLQRRAEGEHASHHGDKIISICQAFTRADVLFSTGRGKRRERQEAGGCRGAGAMIQGWRPGQSLAPAAILRPASASETT